MDEDISVRRLLLRSRRQASDNGNIVASSTDDSAEESDANDDEEDEAKSEEAKAEEAKAEEAKAEAVSEEAPVSSSSTTEASAASSSSTNTTEEFKKDDSEESVRRTDDDLNFDKQKPSKKVNWTEIEEEWNAVMEDDKVREKWDKIDEKLKSGKFCWWAFGNEYFCAYIISCNDKLIKIHFLFVHRNSLHFAVHFSQSGGHEFGHQSV